MRDCIFIAYFIGAVGAGCGPSAVPLATAPASTPANIDDTVAPGAPGAPSTSRPGRALTRNDVSVLFPDVPDRDAAAPAGQARGGPNDGLWPASLASQGGPLLPPTEFERNHRSLIRDLDDALEYDALRVVAVRFDPCFRSARAPAPGQPDDPRAVCQPQIRLVFQARDPAGGFYDGAVHALYRLTPAAFANMTRELRALTALAPENLPEAPLGVSPALAAQGLTGAYGAGLRALVTRYAGPSTLVRVTFMTRTTARSGQWEFSGFMVGGDKLEIALIGVTMQNVTGTVGHDFDYTVHPLFGDPAGRPATDGARVATLDAGARGDLHAWALRQQDPDTLLADTTDCASCHLAGRLAAHLEALDPSLVTPALGAARGPRALGPREADNDNLRAFGWFANAPHVAQRTANETERVVAAFARLP